MMAPLPSGEAGDVPTIFDAETLAYTPSPQGISKGSALRSAIKTEQESPLTILASDPSQLLSSYEKVSPLF